jgi:hypothetical protein
MSLPDEWSVKGSNQGMGLGYRIMMEGCLL